MYTPSKERAKVIRKALSALKLKKLSVKKGRGTASSWVEVRADVEKPTNCQCGEIGYCDNCGKVWDTFYAVINNVANKALADAGMEHSTYYSDDGTNTERSEMLVQVNVN